MPRHTLSFWARITRENAERCHAGRISPLLHIFNFKCNSIGFLNFEANGSIDNRMNRLILILAILLMMGSNPCSEPIVKVGGSQGNSLLRGLTNNTTSNATSLAASGNVINLSRSTSFVQLGGDKGSTIFEDIRGNSSINGSANSTDAGLSSWGSTPRKAPPAPVYDAKQAQLIEILRQNHGL
jgi:hypothetical protein